MKNKQSWKLVWLGACALLFLLAFFLFQGIKNPSWSGCTMGTSFSIRVADSIRSSDLRRLKAVVEARLAEVNAEMSTWDPQSEISEFNKTEAMEPVEISTEFSGVVRRALEISASTGGALDPTVKPLVDYWGFGPKDDDQAIEAIMESVGWQKIQLEQGGLRKLHPAVQLDLSAIAKGYGVDAVAEVIRQAGYENFLVEIGGEVTAQGMKLDEMAWRVGVESPDPDQAFGASIFQVLELSGRALATSGDYRNFRERDDGSRYSHIINPRTGHPAETDVAAVSVLADRCMDADAVATALFVMGSEKGFAWVESRLEFEALFILHAADGSFESIRTVGFPADD